MAENHLANWPAAVELLRRGLAALPAGYRRDRAWYGACLTHSLAGAGEGDEALRTAMGLIPDRPPWAARTHGRSCTGPRP